MGDSHFTFFILLGSVVVDLIMHSLCYAIVRHNVLSRVIMNSCTACFETCFTLNCVVGSLSYNACVNCLLSYKNAMKYETSE